MDRIQPSSTEIARHLSTLEATPALIAAFAKGISDLALATPPSPNAWSALEILTHLRACSDIWGQSIIAMLAEPSPTLPLVHPRKWPKTADYSALGFSRALTSFRLAREELLAALKPLDFSGWQRSASIGGRRHTVFSQVRRMAVHEQEHIPQFRSAAQQME